MAAWCVLAAQAPVLEQVEALAGKLARGGGLRRAAATRGLTLLTDGKVRFRHLDGEAGVLLGEAFDAADDDLLEAVSWPADDDGSAFVRRHWGAYVAIRGSGDAIEVLRDPSAMAPCYAARAGPVWLLTNAARIPFDHGLLPVSVNWPQLAASLVSHDWRPEATALTGLREVLPGTVVSFGEANATCRAVWDPWRFARPLSGQACSPDQLAQTIDRCMTAWGRLYRRPLIEISGGLDSAVVAASLAAHVDDPHLITFAAGPGDPQELGYAQAIADHLGLPLEVVRPEVGGVDLTRSDARDLPRPNARAFTQASDALSRAYAEKIGADVFASGGGGDDVFGYQRSIAPAIDRMRVEGVGRGVLRTLDEIARMTDATLWEALTRFVRRRLATPVRPAFRSDTRLLAADVRCAAPPGTDVGARHRQSIPGKAVHVRAIATLPNHLEGHGRASLAPVLFPLLSQPIVEFSLAVPSWRWCEGGANRALARRAFAERLPASVIERRSKGAFDGFCARLLDANRSLVGELLLEGRLAAQGILDRPAVSAAITNPAPSGELVMRLLALVDAEAWLRSWSATAPGAPQAHATGHIDRASPVPDPPAG
ncbi:asparagine synthase-related protein [Sphingomonas koreensis]|uniref:asparagine synthase-related protein n=1 Tax=Sphingomonas koreensis TaxID=93064 RepID=UPI00234E38E2|nr:asparagine synthase-related protein [Sphingomonas koreensis]MDC7810944.1 asparagine synthase-related protein [Sphingomonas koreensis]